MEESGDRRMKDIRVFENPDDLTWAAAELFFDIAARSIRERGRFAVALAGGSTPEPVYKLIAEKYRDGLDWDRVFFFFGDERNVLSNSPQSNSRMARESLFSALPLNDSSVIEWPTWRALPETVAGDYAGLMDAFFRGFPKFDLVILGLGADCHTASLFPNTEALDETEQTASANWVGSLSDFRFTITFPVINAAANIVFLVAGDEKADAVREVLERRKTPSRECPASFVRPTDGKLIFLLDSAAASRLEDRSGLHLPVTEP